ncbi:hypothetical protein [Paraburkholderia acidicola]|uniref:hypothetical protein n=1 Tax=Paraburkholderia acidicola TaxID=1912599 RepID=UPI001056D5F9|nr:hypothetical protein [Paraburkholderia acidicola]
MNDVLTLDVVEKEGEVALRFRIAEQTSVLKTDDIDSLIRRLILLRSQMQPPPEVQPAVSNDYPLEMDPCWHVDYSPMLGPVLMLRHSGIGWIAYALPAGSIERLTRALTVKPPVTASTSLLWN